MQTLNESSPKLYARLTLDRIKENSDPKSCLYQTTDVSEVTFIRDSSKWITSLPVRIHHDAL